MNIRRVKIILLAFAVLSAIYCAIPLRYPLFPHDYSTVVLDEDGNLLRAFINNKQQWCFPPRMDLEIPDKLKKAVICFEDRAFYYHPGFNPVAVVRAVKQNISSNTVVSGASTLTMQVARIMEPKERTYANKVLEIAQAVKIELNYSKEEILRLYLNHAPYGGNIIGYQAATLRYFEKRPEQLTWGEAATLAVLPNSPSHVSPLKGTNQLRTKRDALLKKLHSEKVIDTATLELALLEYMPASPKPIRMFAPHIAQFLKDNEKSFIIETTIKKDIQASVENLVNQHIAYLNMQGIKNGLALVAETQSGKVRAYVGSQSFFNQTGRGQVDGIRSMRSSASLLKPFLYALCIDEGITLPQTMIKDVPTYYGAFSPSNADKKFNGLVAANEALIRSLNVPAVRLLYTYGVYPFYVFLRNAGVSTLFRTADDYGLPLIIGGAEVTPWDMAVLFRGLGNGGKFSSLQLLLKDPSQRNTRNQTTSLISPAGCYMTLNMLKELKRPETEYYWQQYQNQWPLAWKTGTSYGQKDAWAVGVNPQWTIVVWAGNFDGEGNANLSGAKSAGPLLFGIFNALPKDINKTWFDKPYNDFEIIKICKATGFAAGKDCENTIYAEMPSKAKPLKVCPYHKGIFVTKNDKFQVCSLCWEPGNYKRISRLVYPPDVAQFLRQRGQLISSLPPSKPGCPGNPGTCSLQILYPQENAKLWLPRDFDEKPQKIAVEVAHSNPYRTLFWYVDDKYIGSTEDTHDMAIFFNQGWHTLEILDESGNRDCKRFYVTMKNG